MYTDKM